VDDMTTGGVPAPAVPAPVGPPAPRHENFFVSLLKTGARTIVITGVIAAVLGVGLFAGLLFIVALVAGAGGSADPTITVGRDVTATFVEGDRTADTVVLAVPVSGLILGSPGEGGGFGASVTYGYDVKRWLELAAENDRIDAVMLEVQSPGGTIFGSRAISSGIDTYRDASGRPVWTFVEGLAASGGMWAAASSDRIIADYGSAIGSIGVIYGPFVYFDAPVAIDGGLLAGGVVTQNGIEQRYFTAGRGKDAGNPFRRLTPEEVAVAQQSVDDEYRQFVDHIATTRDIPAATVVEQVGAFVYGNDQAQARKLIDATADRQAAYGELAAKAAGGSGDAGDVARDGYAVYRVDVPQPGWASLFGLFGDGASRGADTSRGVQAEGCRLQRLVLAYSGDPSLLCPGVAGGAD
jgi:protease-4